MVLALPQDLASCSERCKHSPSCISWRSEIRVTQHVGVRSSRHLRTTSLLQYPPPGKCIFTIRSEFAPSPLKAFMSDWRWSMIDIISTLLGSTSTSRTHEIRMHTNEVNDSASQHLL